MNIEFPEIVIQYDLAKRYEKSYDHVPYIWTRLVTGTNAYFIKVSLHMAIETKQLFPVQEAVK
jgi:hypothetical protein